MTLHEDALGVLAGWRAPDAAEEALRERYVAHLASTPDGMRRTSYPDHVTAGTLVIDATGERVLLNLHRKAGRWFHFGGHCEDGDATLAAVALREAHEESGLRELAFHPDPVQLDLHTVPFCGERGDVNHLDVRYVAAAPVDATAVVSDESLAVRWWPVDGLPELEPAMHALIARARALLV
ncbi:NUDIX hydrolase [Pimelobacter simplex]|uniref:NUDIX hydrolase n=1 Tax=Nocardioides simplex TaxID=2045 RepID=UPI001934667D|nr:NUDIX domain-containing protein [Pimelobacter simplex]